MPLGHAQGGSWPKHIIKICNTFININLINILAVIILLMYMYCQGPAMICGGSVTKWFRVLVLSCNPDVPGSRPPPCH